MNVMVQERPETTVRHPEFAARLDRACDNNPHCPEKYKGRQVWLQRELATRFKEKVSGETCRKWFAGEAKPRPDKLAKIAQLLQVDVAWLSLGIDPGMEPRARKARNATADGVVNVIAGLIQTDGGYPAFPAETDAKAQAGFVDLHAIIKGAKYDFHVSLANERVTGTYTFSIPLNHEDLFVLGVYVDGFTINVCELSDDLIDDYGVSHGGSITVTIPQAIFDLHRITTFSKRL